MIAFLRNNIVSTIVILLLGATVVFGLFLPTSDAGKLRNATIVNCQKDAAKSILFQQSARLNAEDHRRAALQYDHDKNPILALNEIASAQKYERIANDYNELTPKDCRRAFP